MQGKTDCLRQVRMISVSARSRVGASPGRVPNSCGRKGGMGFTDAIRWEITSIIQASKAVNR